MSKQDARFSNNIRILNKKTKFEYELLEKFESGIQLKGSEIKSLREGKISLQESFCFFRKEELFIKNMNITQYAQASFNVPDSRRERKLLLKKAELRKLKRKVEEKGLSIVSTKIYINGRGLAKMEVALARGKKLFDKRESIKQKDQQRDLERTRA